MSCTGSLVKIILFIFIAILGQMHRFILSYILQLTGTCIANTLLVQKAREHLEYREENRDAKEHACSCQLQDNPATYAAAVASCSFEGVV